MTTVSPYLWGTNLVTMDEYDLFLADSPTFEQMHTIHIQMVRFPNRSHPHIYTVAARRIQQLGALPLAILPYNNLEADIQMVEDLNAIFGDAPVYYELGNEQDGIWFGPYQSPTDYSAVWNNTIPHLQARARNAHFVGPVNYHANPVYTSSFLELVTVPPDAVSWHEYTCPSEASSEFCLERLERWPAHISETRRAIQKALGRDLPMIVSEWNWNPINTPDPRMQDYDFMYRWTTRAFEILVENQVFASCQYCITNHDALAMLDDRTHALTGQAAAFRDTFERYCVSA